MIGLTGFGGYIPRLRLSRKAIAEANGWIQPGLRGLAKGERSICNWDEDSVTMAVEAARDCLGEDGGDGLRAIYLGSTTLPFQDRQNAGIVAAALNLDDDLSTMDVTSSQRAGTTALAAALEANMEIWIAIRTLVRRPDVGLPPDTAANLERLSRYVADTTLNHGVEIPPHVLDTLININLQISEGLLEGMAP